VRTRGAIDAAVRSRLPRESAEWRGWQRRDEAIPEIAQALFLTRRTVETHLTHAYHEARLFGRLEPTTGIAPFGRLVNQVMTAEPYASARRVFWVVDNGSSHRGQASIDRLEGAWPNLTLVHLPVHASWLNQIEIYFSIVQRKVLTPNDFLDLGEVERRLLGFQRRYQHTAVPFDWCYTRADLTTLLRRLDCAAAARHSGMTTTNDPPTAVSFVGVWTVAASSREFPAQDRVAGAIWRANGRGGGLLGLDGRLLRRPARGGRSLADPLRPRHQLHQ
jgi:hypothetical protein